MTRVVDYFLLSWSSQVVTVMSLRINRMFLIPFSANVVDLMVTSPTPRNVHFLIILDS